MNSNLIFSSIVCEENSSSFAKYECTRLKSFYGDHCMITSSELSICPHVLYSYKRSFKVRFYDSFMFVRSF